MPPNLKARPTTDFARESLFNILNNRVYWEETSALDLFFPAQEVLPLNWFPEDALML